MILPLLFGWPGIMIFILFATFAAWTSNIQFMVAALIFCLPNSFYLFGGNGWIQLAALYIPLSLGLSIYFIKIGKSLVPKILLGPVYGFYIYFGYSVLAQ